MKLRNKLLTVLSFTTIGVATPIGISSCSCSDAYKINYGDSINCKNKDDKTVKYRSINDVKNAAKDHVQVVPDVKISSFIEFDKNNKEICEFIYWDIVYSIANSNKEYTLTWNFTDTNKKVFKDGTINGTQIGVLKYDWNENGKAVIKNDDVVLAESYSYHSCTKA